jgi:hypothetical protein
MGFLDKLLRRDKGNAPPETDAFIGDERHADPGDSPLDQAEERASEARDEQIGLENRIPPGTG